MDKVKLSQALDAAKAAAIEVGEILIKHYGKIESKSKSSTGDTFVDVVTELDEKMELLLKERLSSFDSSFGFRGEENGVSKAGNTTWLVDPIDGTSHFIRGLPYCTTMIALIEDGEVVLSVIYDFVGKNLYSAIKGGGAFCNNQLIHVSNRSLAQSLFAFETRINDPVNMEIYLKFSQASGGIVSFLASGYDFTQIASGKIDGKITKNPYGLDWDFAPGSLLIQEAGGVIANHGSDDYSYQKHDFIATNKIIYDELTKGGDALFPVS